MKKFFATALLVAAVSVPAFAGYRVVKTLPNGDQIVRIKTFGLFAPSTTTVCRLTKAGDLIVLNGAGGPGAFPAAVNAAGLVGAATQLRPARSTTNVEQSGGTATNVNAPSNNNSTTVNPGGPSTTVNLDNSSHNHHNN